MVVFAVWEPILPSDFSKPSTSALGRLSDSRVRQFWDPNHLVSGVLKEAQAAGKIRPECCERKGSLWDLTTVYAPGAVWRKTPPEPLIQNGPIVETTAALDSALANIK